MGLLQEISESAGFLKAGFYGGPGSGKTMTATKLAIRTRSLFELGGPIAFFDTEGGSEYLAATIRKETGLAPVGVKSQSLDDLRQTVRECVDGGVAVLIVDSATHIWNHVVASHLEAVNDSRRRKGYAERTRLEFQDWGPIKERWRAWTDDYLAAPLHIIVCGRAGDTYEYVQNEETEKAELQKTGRKFKAEGEFGYEPSLVIEMTLEQRGVGKTANQEREVINVATVMKDRYDLINGLRFEMPTAESFLPHLLRLVPAKHTTIRTEKDAVQVGDEGRDERRQRRTIALETIEDILKLAFPNSVGGDKAAKVKILDRIFGTPSWTLISERLPLDEVERGARAVREVVDYWTLNREGADTQEALEAAIASGQRVFHEPEAKMEKKQAEPQSESAGASI